MTAKENAKIGMMYLIGTLFNRGISFITVPIFTRLLSPADYGLVNTYLAWESILNIVIGFSLHMGLRNAYIEHHDKFKDIMSTVATFTFIVSASVLALTAIFGPMLGFKSNMLLIIMCIVQSFFSAVISDYSMYLTMDYKYKFRTALMILPNLLSAGLSILAITCVLKTNLYLGRIIPTVLVYIVIGMLVLLLIYKGSPPKLNKKYLKYTLAISAPLIVHGISLSLLSQSDRAMITSLADAAQTGIYSLVYNLSMIATVLTTALDGVWAPWFMRKMVDKDVGSINKRAKDYINLMTYLMVGLMLIAPEILKLLANESYWGGISIIPPIIFANYIIFIYTFYVYVEQYYKKSVFIGINTAIAAGLNIVLNFFLIPKYGYFAAAYTTLISYAVSCTLHCICAKRLLKPVFPLKTFVEPLIHLLASIILFYCLSGQMIARWVIALLYAATMLIRERNKLFEFLPAIRKKRP